MRNGIWKDVLGKYFELNGNKVLATVQKWATKSKEIENYTGGEDPDRHYNIVRGVYVYGAFGLGAPRPVNLLQEVSRALRRPSR